MYTLDRLFADALRLKGPALRHGVDDGVGGYRQVWDAFNRYLTSAMDKRQTLSVQNFAKIGWKVEEQGNAGKGARLRPHFHFVECFMRAHGVNARSHASLPDKVLTQIEEFNFSKAAIRFSQNLTKENVFIGLRGIIQQLGEAFSSGQPISVDFEVGTLMSSNNDIRFLFIAEYYLKEGLKVPDGAVQATSCKPSRTFAPPSKDAMSLSLQGRGQAEPDTIKADALGGWDDRGHVTFANDAEEDASRADSGELNRTAPSSMAPSSMSAMDSVQRAAMSRHIHQLETDAAAAEMEREQWELHLQRCSEEERQELEWRRALNKAHSDHLRMQVQQADNRRQVSREQCIVQASCHDFPSFKEAPEMNFIEYVAERRNHLKEDLDQQVLAKQRMKQFAKEREKASHEVHIEATKRELAAIRQQASAKREGERNALKQSWAKDEQLRSVKKAIQEHHKAPGTKAAMPGLVVGIVGNSGVVPQLQGIPGCQSPRSLDSASGPPSERRPVTGSVRRMPIGAAASLALQKERMGQTLRR
mmetsp:Transcript_119401/g.337817  ORF Transcript_119401/g.337817 Transcript_119401/m.337817 type:complete len:531 (-) Transcript_119401:243-1835(-)